MSPPSLLVATRKGLFEFDREAKGDWSLSRTAFLGDPVTLAFVDPRNGFRYAALNHGHFGCKLHRSVDQGQSWQEIACPAYPPFPDGRVPDRCPMRQIEIPWKLEQMWAFAAGGADQPGRLWCGTLPGGLFRSDDHGDSWALVESLWKRPERSKWFGGGYDYPGIHSICVDPRSPKTVTLAVSCGGVWQSEDHGVSWRQCGHGLRNEYLPPDQAYQPESQDPHFMVSCRAHPDTFWIQHHNGIFRSVDGAATFREIEEAGPSVFGFAVAAHPADAGTAWFVPAIKDELRYPVDGALVVTRTRDGGASFEVLRRGLPQRHAYDLVYRHALAVDDAGEQLAFATTTGNLWATDDQGDSWTYVTGTLPPAHSVAFVNGG